jgi:probable addiction module antidote protein
MRPNISTARAIAEYLTAMIEDGDPALLAAALGDIARRGMTELAKVSGIGRAAL